MALELSRAYVQIVPSMKGVQSDIARQFGGVSGPLDREAGKVGKRSGGLLSAGLVGGLAGGVAGLAVSALSSVTGVISNYVGQAVQASDATDKFKQTLAFAGLKTTAIDTATKRSRAYADATVYDLTTIQNTTAQLAANGVKGYSDITEAAGNLNAVAGGNADTFRSVALVLTQTVGAGKLTTENYNQLAEAIPGASGILQDALKKNGAYTGNFRDAMAKGQITADEFNKALLQVGSKPIAVEAAKSTTTFEGAIGNLQATIVGGLMSALDAIKPAVTGTITLLSNGLGAAFSGVGTVVQAIGPPLSSVFQALGGVIATNLAPLLPIVTQAFGQLGPVFAALLPQIVQLAASLSPTGLAFRALLPVMPQLVAMVGQLASTLGGALSSVLQAVLPVIVQLAGVLTTVGTQVLAALLPALSQVVTVLAGTFTSVLAALLPTVQQLATLLGQALGQAVTLLAPLLAQVASTLGALVTAAAPVVAIVVQLAGQLLRALLPVFVQLVSAVLPPVMQILGQVVAAVVPLVKILGTTLTAVVKALLPVISAVFTAIVPIITAAIQIVVGVINVIVGLLRGDFSQVWRGLGGIVSGAWNLVVGVIRGAVGIVGAAIGAVVKIIGSTFQGAVALVVSVGGQIVSGLANGIRNNAQAVLGAIGGVVKGAIDWAKSLLGIHSPSRVFADIGRFVGQGLVKGLAGSQDQVKSASQSLVNQVTDAFTKLGDNREAAQKRLAKLNTQLARTSTKTQAGRNRASDLRAQIAEQKAVVAANKLPGGSKAFVKALQADTNQITVLAGRRDKLADQLKAAQDDLAAAVKVRDDFAAQVKDTAVGLGNVADAFAKAADNGQTGADAIVSSLQNAITQTQTFRTLLGQLKSFGVDDTTYSQLLEKGVAGGGIGAAQELVQGGPALVQQVAGLQGQLAAAGAQLGSDTSTVLYQAGVTAAQGTVDGIKAKIVDNQAAIALLEASMAQSVKTLGINTNALTKGVGAQIVAGLNDGIKGKASDLDKVIGDLGKSAVNKLRKVLGIHSPSRVFAALGDQTGQGFVNGLLGQRDNVEAAIGGLVAPPTLESSAAALPAVAPASSGVTQIFNGPMGLTAAEVADIAATKARRALAGVNIPKVSVR